MNENVPQKTETTRLKINGCQRSQSVVYQFSLDVNFNMALALVSPVFFAKSLFRLSDIDIFSVSPHIYILFGFKSNFLHSSWSSWRNL